MGERPRLLGPCHQAVVEIGCAIDFFDIQFVDQVEKHPFKKGLMGGEGMFYIVCSGAGPVLVSAFGKIHKIEVDGEYNVDSGHVVAYQDTLTANAGVATGAGFGGFVSSAVVGEGVVMKFQGRGTIYTQSHSPQRLGTIMPLKLQKKL